MAMDVMTKLAAHFQAKAMEESKELSKLADRQSSILDQKKSFRALEDKLTSMRSDNVFTKAECETLEREMRALGLDTADLEGFKSLYGSRQSNGTVHPDHANLKSDEASDTWDDDRNKWLDAVSSKIKNAKDNASDSDDQVSFEIQQRFSAYSRSINQASTTEQKRKEFDDQIIQKWG